MIRIHTILSEAGLLSIEIIAYFRLTVDAHQTFPIHLRSSQTARMEVKFRESKMCRAAFPIFPRFNEFHPSLALMATNCRTLGSR